MIKILKNLKNIKQARLAKNPNDQLELGFERLPEKDRNFDRGGRSFYFFDFDDNVATLSTTIIIFHKETREEIYLSSMEYYQVKPLVGVPGTAYENYCFDYNDEVGSYRNFRDKEYNFLEKLMGKKQGFVKDLREALKDKNTFWKAPSWDFFYYATFNQRPISIITARGHRPKTIAEGIDEFVTNGYLPKKPNYLGIYPVSHPETRKNLGDEKLVLDVPSLKKLAIKESVYTAVQKYGEDHPHRFGMSDDDPKNVQLIEEAMRDLKIELPHMNFFVIDTGDGQLKKREVLPHETKVMKTMVQEGQLSLI